MDTLERLSRSGDPSLSDAVQAMDEPILAADVSGRLWLDVDDPRAFSLAEALLRQGAGGHPA
jgi:hypothetical protein